MKTIQIIEAFSAVEGALGASDARASLDKLKIELGQALMDRDEARAWVRTITQGERVLTCAFCGAPYPPGTPASNQEALTDHVKVCPKHPMHVAVLAEREACALVADAERESCGTEWTDAHRAAEAIAIRIRARS